VAPDSSQLNKESPSPSGSPPQQSKASRAGFGLEVFYFLLKTKFWCVLMKLRETEPGNCFLILFTTTSSPDRQIKISGSEIFDDDLLLHKAPFPLKISKNFGVYPILKTDDQGSAFQKKASISFVSNLNHS
jgi:hypothetical protein